VLFVYQRVKQHRLWKAFHIEEVTVQDAHVFNIEVMTSKSLHTFKYQIWKVIVDLSRLLTLFTFEHVKELEHNAQ
jgi:acetolactate synthase regulatory subunit